LVGADPPQHCPSSCANSGRRPSATSPSSTAPAKPPRQARSCPGTYPGACVAIDDHPTKNHPPSVGTGTDGGPLLACHAIRSRPRAAPARAGSHVEPSGNRPRVLSRQRGGGSTLHNGSGATDEQPSSRTTPGPSSSRLVSVTKHSAGGVTVIGGSTTRARGQRASVIGLGDMGQPMGHEDAARTNGNRTASVNRDLRKSGSRAARTRVGCEQPHP
jgi:hypothetical protein